MEEIIILNEDEDKLEYFSKLLLELDVVRYCND